MSSTTTVRVPDALRARIESVTAASGSTVHAFMVEAIAGATERLERRQDFEAEAERRLQQLQTTGQHLSLADIRKHASRLARTPGAAVPKARSLTPKALAGLKSALRRSG